MSEPASFETRAVLAPKRRRLSRLTLLLPAAALVAIAWAGISGPRSDLVTAEIADPTSVAPPPSNPAQVIGLDVQQLEDVQRQELGRDDVIAVAGWYVATAITDCPRLAALYRNGSLPEVRGDVDELAFCDRSGWLYASPPDPKAAVPRVAVTLVVGVVVPRELEVIGADATAVVVVGRLVRAGNGCLAPASCQELVVDHLAWTTGL